VALVRTNLTAAMQAGDISFVPASLVGFPVVNTILGANHQPVWIQDELMFITQVNAAGVVIVRGRGSDGQRAVFHDILSPVVTSSNPADFPALATGASTLQPLYLRDVGTLGSSQTIDQPIEDQRYGLNGASAVTITVPAPTLAPNGVQMSFTSLTAVAHILSGAALFNNGATGSPFTTITFPAQVGASVTLEAWNGLWNVLATNGTMAYA